MQYICTVENKGLGYYLGEIVEVIECTNNKVLKCKYVCNPGNSNNEIIPVRDIEQYFAEYFPTTKEYIENSVMHKNKYIQSTYIENTFMVHIGCSGCLQSFHKFMSMANDNKAGAVLKIENSSADNHVHIRLLKENE